MKFESLMRQIFGDKARLIASQFGNPTTRNQWFRKALKVMLKRIDEIDTTDRHKQMLMRDTQTVIDNLPRSREPNWESIFSLVSVCSRFLGYDYLGCRTNTPTYFQSYNQKFTQGIFENAEPEFRQSKEDAITIRAKVCRDLRGQGIDTFTIALALNTSEFQVKKLIRENA